METESFYTDGRADRQTDRQAERHGAANSRFSQFCQPAYESLRIKDYCNAKPGQVVNTYRYFENCSAFILRVKQPSTYNTLGLLDLE